MRSNEEFFVEQCVLTPVCSYSAGAGHTNTNDVSITITDMTVADSAVWQVSGVVPFTVAAGADFVVGTELIVPVPPGENPGGDRTVTVTLSDGSTFVC